MKSLILFSLIFLTNLIVYSQPYNHYYGNLHAHSDYSDGNIEFFDDYDTPYESFNYAKKSKNFDFLGISEHNHSGAYTRGEQKDNDSPNPKDWQKGLKQANQANEDGKFVCLYGQEWGTYDPGHVLIYGSTKLMGWEQGNYEVKVEKGYYKTLFSIIAKDDNMIALLAHPTKYDMFNKLAKEPYNKVFDKAIVGVALRNGPHKAKENDYSVKQSRNFEGYYYTLLGKGYHLGASIDHDNHYTNFGRTTQSRLVVLAKSLTQNDIMDALKNRRFFASDDWNVKIEFTLNSKIMGQISSGKSQPKIKLKISDSSQDKVKTIELLYGISGNNSKPKILKTYTDKNEISVDHKQEKNKEYYYLAKIIQVDGDIIWTSPIWYIVKD